MNPFQSLFDAQKSYFASNVTRSHAWRVEQLDRMGKSLTHSGHERATFAATHGTDLL